MILYDSPTDKYFIYKTYYVKVSKLDLDFKPRPETVYICPEFKIGDKILIKTRYKYDKNYNKYGTITGLNESCNPDVIASYSKMGIPFNSYTVQLDSGQIDYTGNSPYVSYHKVK